MIRLMRAGLEATKKQQRWRSLRFRAARRRATDLPSQQRWLMLVGVAPTPLVGCGCRRRSAASLASPRVTRQILQRCGTSKEQVEKEIREFEAACTAEKLASGIVYEPLITS